MAYGQGIACTPIQLMAALTSNGNEGKLMKPRLVRALADSDGNIIEEFDPTVVRQVVSKQTASEICQMMEGVVSKGTGSEAYLPGYRVGGKTGTAQKQPRAEKNYLVSFIGYAPQENPEIMIYVVIDEPNAPDQSATSSLISQLASDIMAEAFPYLNITKAPAE